MNFRSPSSRPTDLNIGVSSGPTGTAQGALSQTTRLSEMYPPAVSERGVGGPISRTVFECPLEGD